MFFQVNGNGDLPAIRTDAFDQLEEGRFLPKRLRLHIQGERKSYTPELKDVIEKTWSLATEEAEERGQELFNGKLFSLLQHQVRQGSLNLMLGETDYKELVGTHLSCPDGKASLEKTHLSNGIAVSSTLLSEDNFLILGRRSQHVHTGCGLLHVCAGHPDPDRLLSVEKILAGENLFFSAMKREILEEFHITEDEISTMVCLGLIRSGDHLKPEVIFQTSLKIPGKEIVKRFDSASHRDEHQEILMVPSAQRELLAYLEEHYEDFTAPGLAAVIFHGKEQGFWS